MMVQPTIIKRGLGRVYRVLKNQSTPRRCILVYHAIADQSWSVSLSQFHTQMNWLADAVTVVPLEDAVTGARSDQLQVALTFDDGYASVADAAMPVLSGLGLTATVFLNTGWIGETVRHPTQTILGHYPDQHFMSWSDVERLVAAGWTIGSHGVEHLDLTRASPTDCERELLVSRLAIENRLRRDCSHFAYTWGRYNAALRRQVQAAGYRYASTLRHAGLGNADDPLALPRINIAREYTLDDFRAMVRGDWDYLCWLQRLKGVVSWQ